MEKLTCRSCGLVDVPRLTIQTFTNGTEHLRADCKSCGGYIKYLPKKFKPLAQSLKTWEMPLMKSNQPQKLKEIFTPPKPPDRWEGALEFCPPMTRALLKEHALLIRVDDEKQRFLIEVRNTALLKCAERKITDIAAALNKKHGKSYQVCLYSLSPLRGLAELAAKNESET